MKSKFFLNTLALFLFSITCTAQVSNYLFAQSSGSYGASFTGTYVGLGVQDDDYTSVTLPFTFNFNGTNYNSVEVATNGFLSFNSVTGTEYYPVSDPTTTNVICALGNDLVSGVLVTGDISVGSNSITNVSSFNGYSVGDTLVDLYGDFNSMFPVITNISGSTIVLNTTSASSFTTYDIFIASGRIRMLVTGTTPNRICTFEYRNFSTYYTYDEAFSFKIRLYETSNKIEYVYGNFYVNSFSPVEVGLKGASTSDYNNRLVGNSNTWATSSAGTSVADACDFDSSKKPANGQTYVWTPTCSLSLTISQSATTACAGSQVTLTASGATSYTWTGVGTTSQVVVSPTINTTYTLTASSASCSITRTVQQNVAPSPTLNVAQSSSVICAGQSATLTASGANSYSWTNNGSNPQLVVTPTANTIYTVTGTVGSCNSVLTVTQGVASIPNLVIVQTKTMICAGETTTLTASGASVYAWSNGSVTPGIIVKPVVTTTYVVTGSNASCTNTAAIVQLVNPCTGIAAIHVENILDVFPNPFHNELTIKSSGHSVQSVVVKDVMGKITWNQDNLNTSEDLRLFTETWTKGIYFITVKGDGINFTGKIIKE